MIRGIEHALGQRLWHFPGGVRLRHYKKMSISDAIDTLPLPDSLTLSLNQSKGQIPPLQVAAGDHVKKYQRLTADLQGLGAHLHAPTSGTVTQVVTDGPNPCLVLDTDGADEGSGLSPMVDWQTESTTTLRQRLLDAGVVGLGGALFPTHAKLAEPDPIRVLIINGAECEPYISCDEMVMRCWPEALLEGTRILAAIAGVEQVVIAIEDQMGRVQKILDQAVADTNSREVKIIKVPTIYPEGGENQLIQVLTGLEVPSGGYPNDIGVVMQNVATAIACRDAVVDGKPLVSRVVTVTGHGVAEPQNFEVRIGTPIAKLIEQVGGYAGKVRRLVIGGPMMGEALCDDQQPTTKGSNCVLALTDEDVQRSAPQLPCIRCGDCQRVCPAQLMPQLLMTAIETNDLDDARRLHLADCIECGCCAYVCPSQIPLVDYYRAGKRQLALRDEGERNATLAKQRYDAHQRRLEEEQAKREAALADREASLRSGNLDQTLADILERKKSAAKSAPDPAPKGTEP